MQACGIITLSTRRRSKLKPIKPIKITKQDVLGYEHTFVIRHDTSTNKVFLAEVDPDFGCESFRGVFGSEAPCSTASKCP